jgi:peptidoglycan/xylan/chitin deacetylase (PgdA/CDA1 family)
VLTLGDEATFNNFSLKNSRQEKPKVCLTFDDGNPQDMPGYGWQEWNALLLGHLQAGNLKAIFFAYGRAVDNPKGKHILLQWSRAGHLIANHTYSHQSYNRSDLTFEAYAKDFLKMIL